MLWLCGVMICYYGYMPFSLGMGFYDDMTDGSMNRWCCPLLHILINGKSEHIDYNDIS